MMGINPLFSVLMANYNNECFIEEAIRSVQEQTYTDWALIIVDDASTDKSWDIISRLAKSNPKIRAFRNEKNMKVGATKRKCVSLASGEICGILDSDDALTPDALAVMVEAHHEHPECSLISSIHYLCHESLQVDRISEVQKPIEPGKSYLESKPGIVHHFWTFKKRFYNETDGFSTDYVLAEDQDLFYKLEEVGELYYLNRPLYYYRIHKDGISTNEKTAIAYSWHIQAMVEALSRRRRNRAKERHKLEAWAVAENIHNFLNWGIGKINSRRMCRHVLDLIRLHPHCITDRRVIRTIAWIFNIKFTAGFNRIKRFTRSL